MNPDNRNKRGRTARLSKARLAEMIEEATVDAYGESEQTTGWFTMIDENLAVPFETNVLDVAVVVERVDLDENRETGSTSWRSASADALGKRYRSSTFHFRRRHQRAPTGSRHTASGVGAHDRRTADRVHRPVAE